MALFDHLKTMVDAPKAAKKMRKVKKKQRTNIKPEDWQKNEYINHPWTARLVDIKCAKERFVCVDKKSGVESRGSRWVDWRRTKAARGTVCRLRP